MEVKGVPPPVHARLHECQWPWRYVRVSPMWQLSARRPLTAWRRFASKTYPEWTLRISIRPHVPPVQLPHMGKGPGGLMNVIVILVPVHESLNSLLNMHFR